MANPLRLDSSAFAYLQDSGGNAFFLDRLPSLAPVAAPLDEQRGLKRQLSFDPLHQMLLEAGMQGSGDFGGGLLSRPPAPSSRRVAPRPAPAADAKVRLPAQLLPLDARSVWWRARMRRAARVPGECLQLPRRANPHAPPPSHSLTPPSRT